MEVVYPAKQMVDTLARAYSCSPAQAVALTQNTPFSRAVRWWGPMFCHWDASDWTWKLKGKRATKEEIIREAQIRLQMRGESDEF